MPNCGKCHTCNTDLKSVLDGEEWCPKCQQYRRYRSHGWRSADADMSPCTYYKVWLKIRTGKRLVSGIHVGNYFVVHETIPEELAPKESKWTITHIPSGYAVCWTRTQKDAKDIALKMAGTPNRWFSPHVGLSRNVARVCQSLYDIAIFSDAAKHAIDYYAKE